MPQGRPTEMKELNCFNEAATDQSRKYSLTCRPLPEQQSFNEAATDQSRKCPQAQQNKANIVCFNEAATDQSRKLECSSHSGCLIFASMRPRLISRGNDLAAAE